MSNKPPNLDVESGHWWIVTGILRRWVPQYDVWAFGSRVTGTAHAYSDLDIVIIADQRLPVDTLAALKEAFSESDLPWKVDVLDWAALKPDFREIIKRNKIVIQ